MGLFDWAKNLYNKIRTKPIQDEAVERAFDVTPAASRLMKDNISLWYDLYTNNPPWETDCIHPLGLPGAIGRELARYTMAEANATVSGGPRAEYLNDRLQDYFYGAQKGIELGLCLGGMAMRPYIECGQLLIDVTSATAFSPIEFDGMGRATSGVFRETVKYRKETYTRLEYHGFERLDDGRSVYVIRNKAYKGDAGGGNEISLSVVPKWSDLSNEISVENLEKPLFVYFKNPSSNDIEPDSQIGVSVYGGDPNVSLLEQADKQWERIYWEYESGERKIFSDGTQVSAGQFHDRLFEYGSFTNEGNLFQPFSPEFRDDPLYRGFQRILQRIEYNVGLSFGTISDPQNVEKTATEILAAKNRQRITVKAIQNAFEIALDGLVYAMNAYCDLYRLAPAGDYEVTYNWGDGVLDDPETLRQDMAIDMQRVAAGLMSDVQFVMKWDKVDEATARKMLAQIGMEEMTTESQNEVE